MIGGRYGIVTEYAGFRVFDCWTGQTWTFRTRMAAETTRLLLEMAR